MIDVHRGELRRHDEGAKNLRRPSNDVVEGPRVDDEQILWRARRGRGFEAETGVALFGKQVPALQFDAHEWLVVGVGAVFEEYVGEGL